MDQKNFISGFSAYLDGELDERRKNEFDRYVEESAEARRLLDSYRRGVQVYRAEGTLEPPVDLEARVMKMVDSERGKVVALRPARARYLVPFAAAALVALALTFSMIFTPFGVRNGDFPVASSTMDVIDVQVASQKAGIRAPSELIRKKQVSLASYEVESEKHASELPEVASRRAVFLVGGVQASD